MNGKKVVNNHFRKGMKMRARYVLGVAILLLGMNADSGQAQQRPMPTMANYRQLVGELVDLKKNLFEEEQRWEEQKAYLENERKLLLKEKEILSERIEEAKKNKSEHEVEIAGVRRSIEQSDKALQNLIPAVERAEIALREWHKIMPESLQKDFPGQFDKIDKGDSLSRRLQKVYGSYAYLEQLSHSVKVTQEILALDQDNPVVFDVIYFGLAQAYAVSKNDKIAAVGRYDLKGLTWTKENGLAKTARETIMLVNGDAAPKMVTLPFRIDTANTKGGQ
jgi:hypothetical protein